MGCARNPVTDRVTVPQRPFTSRAMEQAFRRIIYSSRATDADFFAILRESRTNNGIDGISGLLAFDGRSFVQLLEGPPESVGATFGRIRQDPRHTDIVVISDSIEADRAFGDWTMAGIPEEREDLYRDRLAAMLMRAPPDVRRAFACVQASLP